MNQVMFPSVVPGHCRQGLPIHPLLVDAQPTPAGFVLENLVGELVDAGGCLAGTGVAGDEPASTELVAPPGQAAEPGDVSFPLSRNEQEPPGEQDQQDAPREEHIAGQMKLTQSVLEERNWTGWEEVKFHGKRQDAVECAMG